MVQGNWLAVIGFSDIVVDMLCISLACGTSDSTSILCFLLIYAFLAFLHFPALSLHFPALSCALIAAFSHASPCSCTLASLSCTLATLSHVLRHFLTHFAAFLCSSLLSHTLRCIPTPPGTSAHLPRALRDLPLFPLSCRTTFLSVSPLHPCCWTP